MDLLITIASLLVAVYAIVPRDRQLDLGLRVGVTDWIVFGLGFLAACYLQFYEFFKARGLAISTRTYFPRRALQGVNAQNAIYLVVLPMVLFFVIHVTTARLSRRKISRFRNLAEELFWSNEYSQLFALFQKHHTQLFRIYHRQFLLARLRRALAPDPYLRINTSLSDNTPEHPSITGRLISATRFLLGPAANLLPTYEREQVIATELLRTTLLSDRVLASLARTRPYLAVDLLREWCPAQEQFDFVNLFIKELLKDETSILYVEIAHNHNIGRERYYIPSTNRLLDFFLTDVKVAQDLNVYKPFGDYCIAYLDRLAREPQSDPYSLAMDDFEEVGAWHSPLFVSIRFFDIMVREALFQNIQWHMWLFYLPELVERLARNCRFEDPLIESISEWPNRYCYLIYTAVSAMCDWVVAIQYVEPAQPNVVLRSLEADHDNGNIPKSAILALCRSLRSVLNSNVLPESFKRDIADMVFRLYFTLRSLKRDDYATVLAAAISKGGTYLPSTDKTYKANLIRFLDGSSREYSMKFPREHLEDLQDAIVEH
jgi:hypothetical protein